LFDQGAVQANQVGSFEDVGDAWIALTARDQVDDDPVDARTLVKGPIDVVAWDGRRAGVGIGLGIGRYAINIDIPD
jgi:hypothetical protein